MLIFTTRFSKKKAVLTVMVIGAVIAALVIFAGHFQKGGNADLPQLTDNPQRVAYLQSLGFHTISCKKSRALTYPRAAANR